jgi:hypothetical protein
MPGRLLLVSLVNGKDVSPSDAVETALRLVRNVICQRFPRDLMAIDALQRDVMGGAGLQVGNYAFFAEQAENLFMPSVLFALDEYGIPTAQRLRGSLLPASSLDEVLLRLGRINLEHARQYRCAGFGFGLA